MASLVKESLGQSLFFTTDVLDPPDHLEHEIRYSLFQLMTCFRGKDVDSAIEHLSISGAFSKNGKNTKDIMSNTSKGLLGALLLFTEDRNKLFSCTTAILRDEWSPFIEYLKYFTFTKFQQLNHTTRQNLFWLVNRLVSLEIRGSNALFLGLLRQIKSGSIAQENLELVSTLLSMTVENIELISKQESIGSCLLFVFLRCLCERTYAQDIKTLMVEVCTSIARINFNCCEILGRELIRCLVEGSQNNFESIWRAILYSDFKPSQVQPSNSTLHELRITAGMEYDLKFILEEVPLDRFPFYWDMYMESHLRRGIYDKEASMVDLIRFITISGMRYRSRLEKPIPTWNLVTVILKELQTIVGASCAKLALFMDWLFFDPKVDKASNIALGLQVIIKNVASAPHISSTLIEFLHLTIKNFFPPLQPRLQASIEAAFLQCQSSVQSCRGLLVSPMLPTDIKAMAVDVFGIRLEEK